MKLAVKVVPGASRDEIAGWLGNALKVRVAALPEKGRANRAVVTLLAERLDVGRDRVVVVAGGGGPRKTIEIRGLDESGVRARLAR